MLKMKQIKPNKRYCFKIKNKRVKIHLKGKRKHQCEGCTYFTQLPKDGICLRTLKDIREEVDVNKKYECYETYEETEEYYQKRVNAFRESFNKNAFIWTGI